VAGAERPSLGSEVRQSSSASLAPLLVTLAPVSSSEGLSSVGLQSTDISAAYITRIQLSGHVRRRSEQKPCYGKSMHGDTKASRPEERS
jgi:hypothetical protein